jgi:hypothetical protein
MKRQGAKFVGGGTVTCLFLLFVLGLSGQATADSSKSAFCADMTQVAQADAAVIQHPTQQHVHRLALDLKTAATAVPPATVVANRSQLSRLIATNVLGINTPAIAAQEAHYSEMWAEDTAAMFGYAATAVSSSERTKLAPIVHYVEHACPSSGEALKGLETSRHEHPTSSPSS